MTNQEQILNHFQIKALNPMQIKMKYEVKSGSDLVLISPTGSGKTLGFLLPLLDLLKPNKHEVQALIVVPSRELAIQIEQVCKQMKTQFKVNCCYGGHAVKIEENNLKEPPAILIGTPGRICQHIESGIIETKHIHTLILDEFDKSLEIGFNDEMSFIVESCENIKTKILTSATPLDVLPKFLNVKNPIILDYSINNKEQKSDTLKFKVVKTTGNDKLETLLLLIGKINARLALVFCNHRDAVARIAEQLTIHKIDHGVYHGKLEQIEREKTLIKFRNGSIKLLITTDLAARGLDIPEVDAVIHYQLPPTLDVMIHRNGRTARMNATGTAYFILDEDDHLPRFLNQTPGEEKLPGKITFPKPAEWKTLYISGGKKDKINKMDIVGMILQKGRLAKEDLGKIEILDNAAFAAVKSSQVNRVLELIKNEKIKNRKYKIEISV